MSSASLGSPPPELQQEWAQLANPANPRETRGYGLPIAEIVLTVLCYIIVALRVYIRVFQTKSFGWDDSLIIFNLLPLTGMAVCIYLALTEYGWGRHVYDVLPSMMVSARKMGLLIQIFYLVSTSTTKVSILLFYRRLTDRVSTGFRLLVYSTMFLCIGACIAGLFTHFLGCRPLEAYWLNTNAEWLEDNAGKFVCYNEPVYIVFMATFSMITDFLVCILPLSLFMKLSMHWRQKVALAAIFGVGFFLCFCGIMRMVKIIRTFYHSYDLTWSTFDVWIWTGIEAHMAIVIASLPALNHFFRKVLKDTSISDRFKSLTTRGRYAAGYGSGYNKTGNGTNVDSRTEASDKAVIHVKQEFKLQESPRDSQYELSDAYRINFDRDERHRDKNAWLEGASSDEEDSIRQHVAK